MDRALYTIGHSNHPIEVFTGLLQQHAISAVCDVRSRPSSGYSPQYNRDLLQRHLAPLGIQYVFLGAELGARSADPSCYENGKVLYERIAATAQFQSGIDRIQTGLKTHTIALLCAEKEPSECHRSILVARTLEQRGQPVQHIHADGSLESHPAMMQRLIDALKLPTGHMFVTQQQLIEDAYQLQEERIAYTPPAEEKSGKTERRVAV
jgi:uncharacterized protein (DUF488 family)